MEREQITFENCAGVVTRRFCISLKLAIAALKALDSKPITAYCNLAKMGNEGALDHIFRIVEER